MRLGKSVRLGSCRITEWLFACLNIMLTVPHNMVRLESMSDYRGVRLQNVLLYIYTHSMCVYIYVVGLNYPISRLLVL